MDLNFTPGSDEHEQQLFQEQQDFLYSVLISSLKTAFREALVKDHEGDAQLILELLHEHHTGNSQYSRAEINRITKYLTNIKLDDTWRGTNESFLMKGVWSPTYHLGADFFRVEDVTEFQSKRNLSNPNPNG